MAKRSATPALYEKMRTRPSDGGGTIAPSSRIVEPASRPAVTRTDVGGNWLGPGRVIRLPVGYVLLAAALMIVVVVTAYMVAFKRGQSTGKAELSQMVNDLSGSEPRVTNDPLTDLNAPPSGARGALTDSPTARKSSAAASGLQIRPSSAWGAITADPRKKGLNYFVVAETREPGAKKIAEFCRNNGLETYVIPGKNDGLRRVIVLPGFESGVRSSPEVKSLESRMQDVGDKWKKFERGNSDFRGAYPSLFNG